MARASLALAPVLLAAASASAQTRPLLSEEATTAPAGRLVFETGADFIRLEPNFATGRARDRWDAPLLRFVYSPASNVELDLEWVGRVITPQDPVFGSVSDFGDVTLRAKWRFVEEREGRTALAARFAVTLPETKSNRGLGPDSLRMAAQFLLSKTAGRLAFHANAGLAIQDAPLSPHLQGDFLAYGLAAELHAFGSATLLGEVAGLLGHGHPGADERGELRAGLRYGAGRVRADAAVRRGLMKADGCWGFTAGLAWRVH